MSTTSDQTPSRARSPEAVSARAEAERRRRRREGALILLCGVAVLLFAIWEIRKPNAHVGAGGNVFSFLLVNLNIILLLLLVFLVGRNVIKLVIERRRNVPGSQLRSRMVMAFVAIALFPAAVMLLVSVEFMTNSIDNWFNTEVESSLRGAWRLAQTHYRHSADQAALHAAALGKDISVQGLQTLTRKGELAPIVEEHQRTYKLGTVQVFDQQGHQLIALFNRDTPTGIPLGSDRELLAATLSGETATRVERFGESDIIRGAAPVKSRDGTRVVGAVIVDYLVERSARLWSEEILDAFREYRQLKLNKRPFKNIYILTLALASLVVVFSATWLGLYLARGIADPLTQLAGATRRVAEGEWEVELPDTGGDEIGTLVRAFDSMTVQLRASHAALEVRRRYIENILANIDAGVVAVDQEGLVTTVNPAAISLLGLREPHPVGGDARKMFTNAGFPEVVALLDELRTGAVVSGTRRNVSREEEGRTLQVTATSLDVQEREGAVVLFFENVSQILEVQRMEAWKEVARRIAHEIKNPLTPIQLSAQRMRRRLRDKLDGEDGVLFDDCTNTIVHEVDALKNLVNEFSRFARRPAGEMRACDLNQVVEETMPLYQQARPDLRIDFEGAAGLPTVSINREAVKRALVNLLDNAVAAVVSTRNGESAERAGADGADITVRTRLDEQLSRVVLEVSDRGPGIPPEHRARVFEPYFSTKADGTGLGLAIVASIAADHHAYVRLHDNEPHGSRFVIEFPTSEAA